MEGPDYPIEQFKAMLWLAERLKGYNIQLQEYQYHYHAFGSWWFEIKYRGNAFRVVLDNRDHTVYFEKPAPEDSESEWDVIDQLDIWSLSAAEIAQAVAQLIERYVLQN